MGKGGLLSEPGPPRNAMKNHIAVRYPRLPSRISESILRITNIRAGIYEIVYFGKSSCVLAFALEIGTDGS